MDNTMPTPAKPTSPKAKLITLVIIGLLFIGVPVALYLANGGSTGNSTPSVTTIDYYNAGVKTTIPESSPTYGAILSAADATVRDIEEFKNFSVTSDDVANARSLTAIEITYGTPPFTTVQSTVNSPTSFNRVIFSPTDTLTKEAQIYFLYAERGVNQAGYVGSRVDDLFDSAREYMRNVNQ